MITLHIAWQFGAALGFGMLIGLERERTRDLQQAVAGVRTFAIVALIGVTSVFASIQSGLGWLPAVVFVAIAALIIVSYQVTATLGDLGMTTEVALLLTFLIGALCGWGQVGMAGAIGVACMLLLALKGWLHGLAHRIEGSDVEATLKFAIITLIILPLVPNENFGPAGLEVINPYKTWLMVVLIAGLNFAGYILVKVVGHEQGIGLTGLLGGLVSSTAVTLGFSQRSRTEPGLTPVLVLAILLAWTVMFFRVLIVVALVNFQLGRTLAPGMLVMGGVSLVVCVILWRLGRRTGTAEVQPGHNPFELGEAIKFGGLFAVVIFIARAAQLYLGDNGLYLAGALAGLTDVDAISLSMASLALDDPANTGPAARTIVIAVISNTLVKSGMGIWLGAPALRKTMVPIAAVLAVAGGIGAWMVG